MMFWAGVSNNVWSTYLSLGNERVYLPLFKVADTSFHIQGDDILLPATKRPVLIMQFVF